MLIGIIFVIATVVVCVLDLAAITLDDSTERLLYEIDVEGEVEQSTPSTSEAGTLDDLDNLDAELSGLFDDNDANIIMSSEKIQNSDDIGMSVPEDFDFEEEEDDDESFDEEFISYGVNSKKYSEIEDFIRDIKERGAN